MCLQDHWLLDTNILSSGYSYSGSNPFEELDSLKFNVTSKLGLRVEVLFWLKEIMTPGWCGGTMTELQRKTRLLILRPENVLCEVCEVTAAS